MKTELLCCLATRFLSKIKIGNTWECWEWSETKTHYPYFSMNGKRKRAHRMMYELIVGEIPKEMCVLHRCDNKLCVNPSHLFLGTHGDNMKDAADKGMVRRGSGHWNSKLTEEDIMEIRRLYKIKGYTQKDLGAIYGVGRSNIGAIVRGKRWEHVES